MNIIKIMLGLILSVSLFVSCDKIESPYIQLDDNKVEPLTMAQFDSIAGELNANALYRKFLFEEFTGSNCTNCPAGHQEVASLKTLFGDTMVAVGVHASSLAVPTEDLPYDFRVEEGLQLYSDFGGMYVPFGVLNRTPYNGNVKIPRTTGTWKNAILQRDTVCYAAIQMINQYDEQRQALITNAKITMLQNYANPLYVAFYIIEDKIIKPQKDGSLIIPDYEHNHVLRGSMNGTYGKPLNGTGILAQNEVCLMAYRISFYGKDWVKANCKVVVFVRDNVTGAVLQVEEAEI